MKIDGHTRLAAVIAKPIKHSISPFIHNLAYDLTETNAVYVAWEIDREDLEQSIENIRRYDMLGANISMPYKQEVLQYLDGIDQSAQLIDSVNTIVNQNGSLVGYNTDGFGFFRSLPDFDVKDKIITVLGAGGAASAIIGQAAIEGAAKIHAFDRSLTLEQTKVKIDQLASRVGQDIFLHAVEDEEALKTSIAQSALVVNATGVGMDGKSLPIPSQFVFPEHILVADLTYNPAETPFLRLAREQGLQTTNGFGMLFHQAKKAFELMTGKTMPSEEVWASLLEEIKK